MAKTLILGRAGTGKTRLAMEEVARRVLAGTDDRALLLVPTYGRGEHLKRRLLSMLPGEEPVLLDRSVVTFTSLAERVLGSTAISALASPGVRDHRLRRALERVRAPVFERVRAFPGFRDRFLGLVKEVKEAGLGAEGTAAALEDLVGATEGGAARARLRAFADVMADYAALLREENLLDHEDFQRSLLERLERRGDPPAALARLEWLGVDGFTNFTGLQLRVLDLLAERAAESVVTLPDDPGRQPLFEPSRDTREHFEAGGWTVRRLGEPRRAAAADLRRLEATVFADAPPEPAAPDGSVILLRASDAADEADRIARRAALWIRAEGWRPWEILLVWRSLASARTLLEEAFDRHGVPLRVFASRPLAAEPAARAGLDLLRCALGLADGEAALRAARSGLAAGADPEEGDRLAEAAERRGAPPEAEGVLALARGLELGRTVALLEGLLPADREAAAAPREPAALGRIALGALAEGERLLPAWREEEPAERRAAADAAAIRALSGLVAEVARALDREGRASVAPREFLAAVEESFARAACQPLDRRLHAVNAVDVVEARQWEARGVLVGGLLEKRFPRAPREDLFLRDRDRRRANSLGGPGGALRFAERLRGREEERLLFYTACTRARERLVLSWPAAGPGGERLLPSTFLDEVLRLWPADARPISESRPGDPAPAPGEALAVPDLLRGALPRLAEPVLAGTPAARRAELAAALLEALASRGRGRRLPALARAAALSADPAGVLRSGRLRARFLRPFRTSASGLGDFHQCAYRHFAGRILGLRSPERDAEEGLDPMRLGTVLHGALEAWFRGGRREDPGLLFDARLGEAMEGIRPSLDDLAEALRAREDLVAFAAAEGARTDARLHRPALFEHDFGLSRGGAPPLRFRIGPLRIEVRGRFDRVDLAPDGGAVAVDYKTGTGRREYDEEAHGEALEGADPQVPLYWLALRDALGRRPDGVEIAEVRALRVTGLRAEGAGDPVAPAGAQVLDAAGERIQEEAIRALLGRAAGSLARGEIPARPFDPDRCGAGRCDFADLCRFDGRPGGAAGEA
ncbi:MAG: PD-(D/E)XK nuclease family protein [Planctomycetes bacterium]|nr:PD-(D/E)XK nuclease family protein [Planctomycetota bacterium]